MLNILTLRGFVGQQEKPLRALKLLQKLDSQKRRVGSQRRRSRCTMSMLGWCMLGMRCIAYSYLLTQGLLCIDTEVHVNICSKQAGESDKTGKAGTHALELQESATGAAWLMFVFTSSAA